MIDKEIYREKIESSDIWGDDDEIEINSTLIKNIYQEEMGKIKDGLSLSIENNSHLN